MTEPTPPPRTSAAFRTITAVLALLLLLTIYALFDAIQQAILTGSVSVNSLGRGRPRLVVSPQQAWAHLAGLLLLAAGLISALRLALRGLPTQVVPAVLYMLTLLAIPLGLLLWFFAGHLSTLAGALFLSGFALFFVAIAVVDKALGRTAVVALLVLVALVLVWKYAIGV